MLAQVPTSQEARWAQKSHLQLGIVASNQREWRICTNAGLEAICAILAK